MQSTSHEKNDIQITALFRKLHLFSIVKHLVNTSS